VRISLYSGSTHYHLAGQSGVSEREHSSAADVTISGAIDLQTTKRTRAANGQPYDRLNLIHTVQFSTTRAYASAQAAELAALDLYGNPRTGTLYLRSVSTAGVETLRYLLNAVVHPPAVRLAGCTLLLSYTVTGGLLTSTAP
jgi:hypothetical protein